MRKLGLTMAVLLAALGLLLLQANASTTGFTKDGVNHSSGGVRYLDSLAGAGSHTSASFSMSKEVPESFVTNPLSFVYRLRNTTGSDSTNITIYLQGSYDGTNWVEVDTIVSGATDRGSWVKVQPDLNNYKCPLYRWKTAGAAANSSVPPTEIEFFVYFYLRE